MVLTGLAQWPRVGGDCGVYEHHHGITAVREFPAAPTVARAKPQTGLGRYERLRNFPRKVLCSSDCTGLLPMRNECADGKRAADTQDTIQRSAKADPPLD